MEEHAAEYGDVLPRSTVADMLRREALPRPELLAAFVRACGDGQHLAAWLSTRERLAVGTFLDVEPAEVPSEAPSGRRKRWLAATTAVVVVVIAAVVATVLLGGSSGPTALPSNGWYLLRPGHIADRGLCVGEGSERNKRTDRELAVQRPCANLVPDTYLETLGTGVYLIKWHHPVKGWGCLSVDEASLDDGMLLAPRNCTSAANQRFLFQPVSVPVPNGFVLRPVHSGKCVGLLGGPSDVDAGAELSQETCSGQADQEFLLEPVEHARVEPSS
ncbi:RICIN domain-containing protein [Lentzea sp. NPDC004782]|uniref:RICIN domain-containing protein n=1 Tax=Lentzea sp. NPDC004782 TaxID=3154458 RepID=UPI0033BE49DA